MSCTRDALEIVALVGELKHYPGQHNQANHGNRFGSFGSSWSSPLSALSDYNKGKKLQQDQGNAWEASLTPAERDVIRTYTASYHEGLNDYLRHGEVGSYDEGSLITDIADMASGLMKGQAPYNIETTRGIRDMTGQIAAGFEEAYTTGQLYEDKGFVSTSVRTEHIGFGGTGNSKGIRCFIHIPKGAMGGYVDGFSHNDGELEFILPPGTRFKVVKFEKASGSNPKTTVHLSVLKPGHKGAVAKKKKKVAP